MLADLRQLDDRSAAIFRHIVESYLETGDPVGSRNISKQLPTVLSPASVRNVMADLEQLGLIYSRHTSAGRMPTETGLRLFVDGMLELGDLSSSERRQIENSIGDSPRNNTIEEMLTEASELISGLSHCAGVVLTDKQVSRVKHIEFVQIEQGKALVVMVGSDGHVENRIVEVPHGLPGSTLVEAANYLNSMIGGMTFAEARNKISENLETQRAELDELTAKVIEAGLATWSGGTGDAKSLIVRGRSHLLSDVTAEEDLDRIRLLFDDLEAKRELIQILQLTEEAEGVRIFIGSENKLFSLSGSSLIVAPFQNEEREIVGVVGVIGPTRINYGRIIPMVDYTAQLIGRLMT